MPEIGENVKRNLKDRLRPGTLKREVDIVKNTIKKGVELKPVVAGVDLVTETIDNVGDFVKTQAKITRRWIE